MKAVIGAAIVAAALSAIPQPGAFPGVGAPPIDRVPAQPSDADQVACTFSHPQYVGGCVEKVTPTEKQTPVQACRVILDCLNNSRCVKTYCQSTTIRGGWTLVSPKEKELTVAAPGGYGE